MDAASFKGIQKPLKDKYREEPASALITLRARGKTGDGISCRVESGKSIAEAGLHPATGGNGQLLCSGDMLLEALVACAGVTLSAVATALDIHIKRAEVSAEGDIDFRGTLGVDKNVPAGFISVRLAFEIESAATPEQLETLLKLTERYCVVYQTIKNATTVSGTVTQV